MLSKILFTAFAATFALAQTNDVTPLPGSISASFNVTSLNNIMQLAAPLSANKLLNDHTFDINYKKTGFLGIYALEVKSIHFITVDDFSIRDVSFKEGTDTLVVTVGGINVNATCEASASGLWVIGTSLDAFTLTNITVQIELTTTSDDQVHWQLSETTRLSLGDLTLTMGDKFWNKLVTKHIDLIKGGINKGLQAAVNKIDALAASFNLKLANGDEFISASETKPFNWTMTTAPEFNPSTGLININMDGRYVDPVTGSSDTATGPLTYPAHVDGQQREEVFIHQSFIAS
jgi:hypothetical protein